MHCRRWPGVRAARTAIEAADPRSESPLESLSRLKIVAAGLPNPELQTTIADQSGQAIGRVDFYWEQFGAVGEADGLLKYDGDESSLRREKIRQEKLEQTGLIVVRWGSADLSAFDRVEQRLRSAFTRGRRPGSSRRTWNVVPTPTLTPPMRQDVLRYVIGGVKVG